MKSEQQMSNKRGAKRPKRRKMTGLLKNEKTLDWQGFHLAIVIDVY
jgi:hypothetical protein